MNLGYAKHYNSECIINVFIVHYEHTLMKDNKRYILTREEIIMMMGKTEQYVIEQGATIQDLEPTFTKYRLKVRMFDACAERMLWKYDHPYPDSHAKPFYWMLKHNHTCVICHDWKSSQKHQIIKVIRNEHMHLKIVVLKKKRYDDDEHCKMINCLHDTLQLIKDHGKVKKGEEPIYNLVLRDDNLNVRFVFIIIPRICI